MQCLTYVVSMSLSHNYRKVPCQPCAYCTGQCLMCTKLLAKPMTMVFGLGSEVQGFIIVAPFWVIVSSGYNTWSTKALGYNNS